MSTQESWRRLTLIAEPWHALTDVDERTRFEGIEKMEENRFNLGERQSIHRTFTLGVIFWPVVLLPLLVIAVLAAFYTFDSFTFSSTESKGGAIHKGPGSFICLGGSCLMLALIGSVWISDFRKWYATRSVKLSIYQRGFTYKSQDKLEACRWEEIRNINFRVIEVRHKHSPATKVRVIRSIERRDGEVIDLAETLNLVKLTGLINTDNRSN